MKVNVKANRIRESYVGEKIVINHRNDDKYFNSLASELNLLMKSIETMPTHPQQQEAVNNIKYAEVAAKEKDTSKMTSYLQQAGQWAFEVATKIGTTLAAEALKKALM
jgi:uncharacterized protein YdcH (DUF465 family)